MKPLTDLDVITAITRHGGSFALALADAFLAADAEDRQKIKDTWPSLWSQYRDFARYDADKENQ
jgi:hypothetical protein